MAPVGAAVVLTRVHHSVLFAVIHVASAMLSPVILFISSIHDVIGRPLPRLPSTEPCKMSFSTLFDAGLENKTRIDDVMSKVIDWNGTCDIILT